MALTKQAKLLSDADVDYVMKWIARSQRYPLRDTVRFLLSVKAGLRAKEIASVEWPMVLTPKGNLDKAINLPNSASKGKSGGRVIPMHPSLHEALLAFWHRLGRPATGHIIGGAPHTAGEWFRWLYKRIGLSGCSSHSGRRTFITKAARRVKETSGSIRDVQLLAGHASLNMTMRYIDGDPEAQRALVNLL